MTRNQIEEAALFREYGLSWRKIAACYGVSHGLLINRVTRYNQCVAAKK